MELSEIRITVENWEQFDLSPSEHHSSSIEWQEVLDVQTDINRYLDASLDWVGRKDWAGRYASFLRTRGIEHQTDNGWWGKEAASHENLTKFVSQWK